MDELEPLTLDDLIDGLLGATAFEVKDSNGETHWLSLDESAEYAQAWKRGDLEQGHRLLLDLVNAEYPGGLFKP